MSVLHRKLIRDLLGNVGLLATVVSIIAVGVGTFVGMGSVQRILTASQAKYYRDYRFADFWIDVKKAPLTVLERIQNLPGIDDLAGRVVFDVILDLPDEVQPVRGRMISVRPHDLATSLNGIHLVRGTGFSDDREREVILGEAFAAEHGLAPGDTIHLLLNRRRESFIIAGTALSPEYVYMVSGPGDLTPDARHFGILFVRDRFARDALDFQGACNQITGTFATNDPGTQQALLDRIERMLDPFGVLQVTPRERHASHRFLSDEIHGLRVNSVVMPSIFLLVAALVLNIMMSRLAERQRTIIGTLKAIGRSGRELLIHFLLFAVIVGIVGAIAGVALGLLLTSGLLAIYPTFFEFPAFLYHFYPNLWLGGLAISVGCCVLGTLRGARNVLRLQPAEAMRQKPPERGRSIFLERFAGLWDRLDFRTRMALRSVLRHPFRTGTAVFSAAISTALVLMTLMSRDSVLFLVDFQFNRVSKADVSIGLRDARTLEALYEVRNLPAVDYAEADFSLACDVRSGRQQRRIGITGLPRRHRLTIPMTHELTPIDIPPEGLVMSRKLADLLGVGLGDSVELTPARGRRRAVSARVASIMASYLGLECYADRDYLSGLIGENGGINGLQLATNPPRTTALYRAIKQLPNAQGLTVRANARAAMEGTFVETMKFTLTIMILLAGVIAFGSILNNTRVEIAERQRDIATLRTLGYRPSEIAGIFFRQNLATFGLSILLGLPCGYWLTVAVATAYNTELFRMPVVVHTGTLIASAAIALVFVLCAQLLVYRQITRLDWQSDIQVKE